MNAKSGDRRKAKWVLIAALGEYASIRMPPLPGVIQDANRFDDVLRVNCDTPIAETVRLYNKRATKETILSALNRLSRDALESDQLIFYFAGHGGCQLGGNDPMPDGMTRYLLPYEATEETPAEDGISSADMFVALAKTRTSEIVVVFDCCYSGGLTGVFWKEFTTFQQAQKSCYVIAAAQPIHAAGETDGGGLLTQHLCDALEGQAPVMTIDDGLVSAQAAYLYASEAVKADAKRIKLRQETVATGIGNSIYLTRLCDLPTGNVETQPTRREKVTRSVLDFEGLIARKTRGFIGREWLTKLLDNFVSDNDHGYFIVQGLPGTGKTSFSAMLVASRGYPHHFNDSLEGVTSPKQFTQNLAHQLIARHRLSASSPTEEECHSGTYLRTLLEEVSGVVTEQQDSEVIVVDALDEAEVPSQGNNVLFWPHSLPKNVFFVLTRREVMDFPLFIDAPSDNVVLEQSDDHSHDIRQYLEREVRDEAIQSQLNRSQTIEQDFVELLLEKSEQNFMYLDKMLPAIKRGEYSSLVPDVLPQGLQGYYERHWQKMRGHDAGRWENILLPVICVLAVAREPLSVDEVHEYVTCGFPDFETLTRPQVRSVIRVWREFLWESRIGSRTLFRIYHTSFQDFLQMKDEITEEIHLYDAHKWIANTLWNAWEQD